MQKNSEFNMRKLTLALLLTASSAGFSVPSRVMAQDAALDRTVLPISQPQVPTVTELDARNVSPPPPFAVKAPSKAPNVLIILLDDMGFGQPSAFGGPIHMPTLEQLASQEIGKAHA